MVQPETASGATWYVRETKVHLCDGAPYQLSSLILIKWLHLAQLREKQQSLIVPVCRRQPGTWFCWVALSVQKIANANNRSVRSWRARVQTHPHFLPYIGIGSFCSINNNTWMYRVLGHAYLKLCSNTTSDHAGQIDLTIKTMLMSWDGLAHPVITALSQRGGLGFVWCQRL